jgi:hypothetical protein
MANKPSTAAMCPSLDPGSSTAVGPVTVFPGCPCNASGAAAGFLCPAGHVCSQQAYTGLSTDVALQATHVMLHATCVACARGMFCPEGSTLTVGCSCNVLMCPAWWHAARLSLAEVLKMCRRDANCCWWCRHWHVQHAMWLDLHSSSCTWVCVRHIHSHVVSAMLQEAVSASQQLQCQAGQQCPTPAQQLPCPPGSFCPAGSAQPLSCDYSTWLAEQQRQAGSSTVLQQLLAGTVSVAGNFCPAGSAAPGRACR